MKSEERHHLEENELADWLAKTTTGVRPYLPIVAGIVAIIIVVAFGYSYWSSSQVAEKQAAWTDFLNAAESVRAYVPPQTGEETKSVFEFGAERFEEVAAGYPGTEVAARARLRAADYRFEHAKTMLLKDRGQAITKLDEVVQQYDRLAKGADVPDDVRRQAMIGKALALESQGALKLAKEAYQQIVSRYEVTFPDLALQVKEKIELLDKDATKDFYAKLAEYQPEQPSVDLPPLDSEGGTPPLPPIDSGSEAAAPKVPSLDLEKVTVPNPPTMKDEKEAKKDSKEEPKAAEKPAETKPTESDKRSEKADAKSAEEKPAETKPVEEKPADAKPAETKPADEKPADAKPADETPAEAKETKPEKSE